MLPLLIPKASFKNEIIDHLIKRKDNPSKMIVLRIEKNLYEFKNYKKPDTTLIAVAEDLKDLYLIDYELSKSYGYFEIENFIVIVCGDGSAEKFFLKSRDKKQVDIYFLETFKNQIYPPAYKRKFYFSIYHNGQFSRIDSSRILAR